MRMNNATEHSKCRNVNAHSPKISIKRGKMGQYAVVFVKYSVYLSNAVIIVIPASTLPTKKWDVFFSPSPVDLIRFKSKFGSASYEDFNMDLCILSAHAAPVLPA